MARLPDEIDVGLPWTPIFDRKTLEWLDPESAGSWSVVDGALVHKGGAGRGAQSRRDYGDGEFRMCFEMTDASLLHAEVRQGPGHSWSAEWKGAAAKVLEGRTNELVFRCAGENVTAVLNGTPVPLNKQGSSPKGRIRFWFGGSMRVLSLEQRDIAPEQLAVGQKGKDGWTCMFNGRDFKGWSPHGGLRTIEDEAMVLSSGEIQQRIPWSHFELKGRIMVNPRNQQGDVGFFFVRSPNSGTGPNAPARVIFRADGNVLLWSTGNTIKARAGAGTVTPKQWVDFSMRVFGEQLEFSAGNRPPVEGPAGKAQPSVFAVCMSGDGQLIFRDLRVRELDPDGKPVDGK